MPDSVDTPSGLPYTHQNKASESDRAHPLVVEWIALHKATALPWRHYGIERSKGRVYGYYSRCESGGHIVAVTAYEDPDRVLFAYAGPNKPDGSMGQRSYIEFEAGLYREKTEQALREIFHHG